MLSINAVPEYDACCTKNALWNSRRTTYWDAITKSNTKFNLGVVGMVPQKIWKIDVARMSLVATFYACDQTF